MQAICDAYTKKHPDVSIEVQVTSWNEYWTKLEAAATSNKMPDIFWMHTNEILKYADYGKLEDLTDLYDDEDENYYKEHFSDISLKNSEGSNGHIYGVPKDKDTVCLVYNKEMFDKAGVKYPDESWTWDDLTEASEKFTKQPENTVIWRMRMISWDIGILYIRKAAIFLRMIRKKADLTIQRLLTQ